MTKLSRVPPVTILSALSLGGLKEIDTPDDALDVVAVLFFLFFSSLSISSNLSLSATTSVVSTSPQVSCTLLRFGLGSAVCRAVWDQVVKSQGYNGKQLGLRWQAIRD